MFESDLGKLIKQIRKIEDKTQEELAEILKVSQSAIVKWENNQSQPGLKAVKAFKEKLGYDLTESGNITKVVSLEKPPVAKEENKSLGELISSNKTLADAHKNLTSAHKTIAEENRELRIMLKEALSSRKSIVADQSSQEAKGQVDDAEKRIRSGDRIAGYGLPKKKAGPQGSLDKKGK